MSLFITRGLSSYCLSSRFKTYAQSNGECDIQYTDLC